MKPVSVSTSCPSYSAQSTQQEPKFKSRKTLPGPGNNDSMVVVLARDEQEPDVLGGFGYKPRAGVRLPPLVLCPKVNRQVTDS